MWTDLSIKDKSDLMSLFLKQGISSLSDMRRIYDGLSNTKSYKDWKEKVKKYKNIDIDNDKSYDYIGFYNENPERAYELLKENPDTHFTDKYKTPLHPTFSDESIYSNNRTKGGHWIEHPNNKWEFQHSDYTAEHLEDTNRYLQENDINSYATYKNGIVLNPAIIIGSKKRIYDGTKDTKENNQSSKYNIPLDFYNQQKKLSNSENTYKVKTIQPSYQYKPIEEQIKERDLVNIIGSPFAYTPEEFNKNINTLSNTTYIKDVESFKTRITHKTNYNYYPATENALKEAVINNYDYDFKNRLYNDFRHANGFDNYDEDSSKVITIKAPNTDISKFIYNRNISENAINRIAEVSKKRNIDPYDLLSHILIEGNDNPLTVKSYYNTHNIMQGQLPGKYSTFSNIRKDKISNLGLDNNKEYSYETLLKFADKWNNKANYYYDNNVIIPEDPIDAVAVYISKINRDFNPLQKGWTNSKTGKIVKNSYLDMIDSAISSLKSTYPNLFKNK